MISRSSLKVGLVIGLLVSDGVVGVITQIRAASAGEIAIRLDIASLVIALLLYVSPVRFVGIAKLYLGLMSLFVVVIGCVALSGAMPYRPVFAAQGSIPAYVEFTTVLIGSCAVLAWMFRVLDSVKIGAEPAATAQRL